jgi:hypothetical protein
LFHLKYESWFLDRTLFRVRWWEDMSSDAVSCHHFHFLLIFCQAGRQFGKLVSSTLLACKLNCGFLLSAVNTVYKFLFSIHLLTFLIFFYAYHLAFIVFVIHSNCYFNIIWMMCEKKEEIFICAKSGNFKFQVAIKIFLT